MFAAIVLVTAALSFGESAKLPSTGSPPNSYLPPATSSKICPVQETVTRVRTTVKVRTVSVTATARRQDTPNTNIVSKRLPVTVVQTLVLTATQVVPITETRVIVQTKTTVREITVTPSSAVVETFTLQRRHNTVETTTVFTPVSVIQTSVVTSTLLQPFYSTVSSFLTSTNFKVERFTSKQPVRVLTTSIVDYHRQFETVNAEPVVSTLLATSSIETVVTVRQPAVILKRTSTLISVVPLTHTLTQEVPSVTTNTITDTKTEYLTRFRTETNLDTSVIQSTRFVPTTLTVRFTSSVKQTRIFSTTIRRTVPTEVTSHVTLVERRTETVTLPVSVKQLVVTSTITSTEVESAAVTDTVTTTNVLTSTRTVSCIKNTRGYY